MYKPLAILAATGHLRRRHLAVVVAVLLMAMTAAGFLLAAGAISVAVAWLWCDQKTGGMAAMACEVKRAVARLGRRGIGLVFSLADFLQGGVYLAAIAARRLAPLPPPRLPAAGFNLTPRLFPAPAAPRA